MRLLQKYDSQLTKRMSIRSGYPKTVVAVDSQVAERGAIRAASRFLQEPHAAPVCEAYSQRCTHPQRILTIDPSAAIREYRDSRSRLDQKAIRVLPEVAKDCFHRRPPFDDTRLLALPTADVTYRETLRPEIAAELGKIHHLLLRANIWGLLLTPAYRRLCRRSTELIALRSSYPSHDVKAPYNHGSEYRPLMAKIERRVLARPWGPKRGWARSYRTPFGEVLLGRFTGQFTSWVDLGLHLGNAHCGGLSPCQLLAVHQHRSLAFRPAIEFEHRYFAVLYSVDLFVKEMVKRYESR